MRIRTRLVSLLIFLVLLLISGRIASGGFDFILIDFWFNAGLLMLLFGVLIDQPFYSKDADILLNGVAGALSMLAVPNAGRGIIWWALLLASAYLIVSSYILMYLGSKHSYGDHQILRSISRINRFIGSPKPLFSILFCLGCANAVWRHWLHIFYLVSLLGFILGFRVHWIKQITRIGSV